MRSFISKSVIFLLTLVGLVFVANRQASAQSAGEVMFVGFNSDGNDGFAFVTFVPLPTGTTIHFSDNEWNGSAIGSGGAFNNLAEGEMTWQNNTGNSISAGTIIVINNSATTPVASLGTVSSGTIALDNGNEVLYMFLGTDSSTPSAFLSAIANDGFSATNGQLTNTGLTSGTNATSITGDEDVMVYTGSVVCTTTIATCAATIATGGNWTTEDGGGDQSNNGGTDFPTSVDANHYGTVFQGVTYYSRNATSGGNWDDPNSWTTVSDGSGGPLATGIWPASADNVVILPGHTITINAITDNNASGISPDGLGRANVGPFAASNLSMFYQTGDITVAGTLTVTGIEMMTEGYTHIQSGGTFNLTSSYVNLGYMEADAGSTLSSADDLILAGNSNTTINTTSISNDDLIISFTDARLCGSGTTTLQNGSGSLITYANGATVAQICTDFTVNCTGAGCSGFPVVGTGVVISGNTGPGGVGNSADNQLWLRAEDITGVTNGGRVTNWPDNSGNGLAAVANSNPSLNTANQPQFNTAAVNGVFPSVSFDGGDYLTLGTPASLNLIPQTDSWSFFVAYNVTSGNNGTFFSKATGTAGTRQYQYTFDGNTLTSFIGGNYNIGSINTSSAWAVGSHTNTTARKDSWSNGNTNVVNGGVGNGAVAGTDVLVGARRNVSATDAGFLLTGSIAEIVVYDKLVNTAHRIIVDNYLAAKYGVTLAADDVYTMDNAGNGNYDFEVAGIGQGSDGSRHLDARGTGVVRMWNPDGLGNNEFLLWGHDNTSLTSSTTAVGTAVDGTVIQERLSRIWRVGESGDVGNVSVSFDFSGLSGSPLGSNLRLLIDRDGDGFADNDVAPIAGSVLSGVAVFSNVNFQNGDRFTLGNTDASMPLPITLVSFTAEPVDEFVVVKWKTENEINNDYFELESSADAESWNGIAKIEGAGNSNIIQHYTYQDVNPMVGISYYRLRQVDFDGQAHYSGIVSVEFNGEHKLIAYPNPSSGRFGIVGIQELSQEQVRVINSLGQLLPFRLSQDGEHPTIDLSDCPSGTYLIQISDGQRIRAVRVIRN